VPNYVEQGLQLLRDMLSRLGISYSATYLYWVAVQGGVLIGCFVAARLVRRLLEPALERAVRSVKGNPPLLRMLVVLLRRITPITFTCLLWISVAVMRATTWPSRSYLLSIAASLATAWVVISIVSKLVRNRFLSNVVAWAAWIIAALNILGLLPQTAEMLDAAAFELQDFRLSLLLVLKSVAVLSLLLWIAVTLGRFVEQRIEHIEDLTPSLRVLIVKIIKAVLIVIALMAGLSSVGIDFTVFAFFSGAVGLGLGFGLQKVVSNLVSGIILLLDKSIKPGDVITVGDTFGTINSMSARYVSVIARDGREYLIPNEDLITNQVLNWSYSSDLVRIELKFGTSYNADPHMVRKLANAAAATHARVVDAPPPACHITEFGDSSINYILRFWITDPSGGVTNLRGDVYLALWDALKENGVEIPYPHREVIVRGPIDVRSGAPDDSPA
jgi:small-conductance mechanosensitive channel